MKNKLLVGAIATTIIGAGFLAVNSNDNLSPSYEQRKYLTFSPKAQGRVHAQEFEKMFRADVNTGEVDPNLVLKAREKAEFLNSKRASVGLQWKERGPDNIGGRTRALIVDKLDTTGNTVYAGSIAGGLFKSDNGGGTWYPINDLSPASAISCIDQGTNGTIYVGTGCAFENFDGTGSSGVIGRGMYKSTDGTTFTLISSTIPSPNSANDDWAEINAVAVDPTNDNRLFAATQGGLMLSENGGNTWTCVYAGGPNGDICFGNGYDVKFADDGKVLAVVGSKILLSPDGSPGSFADVTGNPGGSRTIVKYAPSNNDTAWALSESGGELLGLYLSTDRGASWTLKQGESQSAAFGSCCGLFNGQGFYDLALGVSPRNSNEVFIGGVQFWKYNGGVTRIASEFTPNAMFNVHSDKHDIVFDPHNPNKMFVVSDGGITISFDYGETYWPANKGYNTLTCYAVAFDKDGKMMAGAQDNGTYEVTGNIFAPGASTGLEGVSINGGDGYDCDYSQITNIRFSTIYTQAFSRGVDGAALASICTESSPGPICEQGSFYTVGRLWESDNDPTSQDTILFSNTNAPQAIKKGDGTTKSFTFTIAFAQDAAQLVPGSIKVYAGTQTLTDSSGVFIGDGSGTITYTGSNKGYLDVKFLNPPSTIETVWVEFETKYSAGDKVQLVSNTNFEEVEYTLPMNVNPGDELKVVDPIQSIYAAGMIGGVSISRNSLRLDKDMDWIDITSGISGIVSCIEFSADGNHMFVGTGHNQGSNVYRVSGLNNVYSADDVTNYVTVTNLGSTGGSVTGIAVDPNNPDNIVVTSGNYGQSNFVWRSTNATTATGNALTSIQGNLPEMPCFDAIIMVDRPGVCVIGTDMGIYATDDMFASSVTWTDESSSLSYVPVFALRQQTLPYSESGGTTGRIYVGTHGRAMWESTTGTNVSEIGDSNFNNTDFVSELNVYPNPMVSDGTIAFNLSDNSDATVYIFDLNGRMVKTINKKQYTKGLNNITLDVSDLQQGTYLITIESNNSKKVAKFVKM